MLTKRFRFQLLAVCVLLLAASKPVRAGNPNGPALTGIAVLPAASIAEGPVSGNYIGSGPVNGQRVPIQGQPVQGFSAIADGGSGAYWVMSDNGFGTMANSSDYHLRLYKIEPDFKTADGGTGAVKVVEYVELSDPSRFIQFPIVNGMTLERILTGADFDPESMQFAPDGSIWIGDEFGPFLLHFNIEGVLLEPPIPVPDVQDPDQRVICAPENPYTEEGAILRLMNAFRTHAQVHGTARPPVFSPWANLLIDGDPNTVADSRLHPPAGVEPAQSEIFDLQSLQRAGFPVVVWTVNRPSSMTSLLRMGVDALVTDRPDLLIQVVGQYDPDRDGQPDLMEHGLIDVAKFDAQGHGGAGYLRPENSIPAVEVALDNLMTTLVLDLGVTRDSIPVLSHEPYVPTVQCRFAQSGGEYDNAVLIRDSFAEQIQSKYVCDKLVPDRPAQTNDLALSPVAVAFAEQAGLSDPYVMPTLQDVFDFVEFYVQYYSVGEGARRPGASLRATNAKRVRYSLTAALNPRAEFAKRTLEPGPFADAVAGVILRNDMAERADIRSFDFRTLVQFHIKVPTIRTVFLFGDWPAPQYDGANLQPDESGRSPWLAGAFWPYRRNQDECAGGTFRSQSSGGLEGMALSADGSKLLLLFEKPLANDPEELLLLHEFDLASGKFTGTYYWYPLDDRGVSIGDLAMYSDTQGLAIEQDSSQGDLSGFKAIYKITLDKPGQKVKKELVVDLLNIRDPGGLAAPLLGGQDVLGVGETFAFPFVTIAGLLVIDETHIGILNDNNYPFSNGRHVISGDPDDNEFIVVELPQALTATVSPAAASGQTVTPAAIGGSGAEDNGHTPDAGVARTSLSVTTSSSGTPTATEPPHPSQMQGKALTVGVSTDRAATGATEPLVHPVGIPYCVNDDTICFERPLEPDCVDDGAICLLEARPGPFGSASYRPWRPDEQPHYGQLQYARIDLKKGARLENLLAGQTQRPRVFCWRTADHSHMDEPAGPFPFVAWTDFDPLLGEPANLTVIERNSQPGQQHLHLRTVLSFAQRRDSSGRPPIFVLNGSFFSPECAPEGSQWLGGRMLRVDPNHTMVAFSQDGKRAEILWGDGTPIQYGQPHELKPIVCREDEQGELEEVPQIAAGADLRWVYTAIGGGPVFVLPDPSDLDGHGRARVKVANPSVKTATTTYVPFNPLGEGFGQPGSLYEQPKDWKHRTQVFAQRSPRSFVCVGDDVVLLGTSKYMSGPELGRTLVQLGCHTALGLDDNTSSSFVWRGRYGRAIWKADRYRWVANAIGVYSRDDWPQPQGLPDAERLGHGAGAAGVTTLDVDEPTVWVLWQQQVDWLRGQSAGTDLD